MGSSSQAMWNTSLVTQCQLHKFIDLLQLCTGCPKNAAFDILEPFEKKYFFLGNSVLTDWINKVNLNHLYDFSLSPKSLIFNKFYFNC